MGGWQVKFPQFHSLTSLNLESLRTLADEGPSTLNGDDTEDPMKEPCPINGYCAMTLEGTSGHLSFLMAGNICLK